MVVHDPTHFLENGGTLGLSMCCCTLSGDGSTNLLQRVGFTICSREGLEIFVGETLKIGKGPNKLQTLGVTISGCACLDNVPTFP